MLFPLATGISGEGQAAPTLPVRCAAGLWPLLCPLRGLPVRLAPGQVSAALEGPVLEA